MDSFKFPSGSRTSYPDPSAVTVPGTAGGAVPSHPHAAENTVFEFYGPQGHEGSSSAPAWQNQHYAVSARSGVDRTDRHGRSPPRSLPYPYPSPAPISAPASAPATGVHPHVALRAASPQSTVSSENAAATASEAGESLSTVTAASHKKSIDRNRRPCGNCSSSKRKCKIVSTSPHLCERCRNHGLLECPPHISWTVRKASVCESGSLSPTDERALSSRSASPSYVGAGPGRSPPMFPSYFEGDEDVYDTSTTQAWVQTQANTVNAEQHGMYDTYLAPPAPSPSPNYTHQDMQSISNFYPPITPVCHVCNTPYDELLLGYALTAAVSASYEEPPMSTPYDHTSFGPAPAPGSYENSY